MCINNTDKVAEHIKRILAMDERVTKLGLNVFTFPVFCVKYVINTRNAIHPDSLENNIVLINWNK